MEKCCGFLKEKKSTEETRKEDTDFENLHFYATAKISFFRLFDLHVHTGL